MNSELNIFHNTAINRAVVVFYAMVASIHLQ